MEVPTGNRDSEGRRGFSAAERAPVVGCASVVAPSEERSERTAGVALETRLSLPVQLEALGIDRQKLGDAMSAHITVQQNLLAAHIHSADVTAKKKLAEEGARTLLSIGLSVVGGRQVTKD